MLRRILFLFLAFVAISEGLSEVNSKFWLTTCSDCYNAFNSCMNCFGESGCKTCISMSKQECSVCADEIYNKDNLETINESDYLVCDLKDSMQTKVCHFYCRGHYAQSGQCVVENSVQICKCASQPGSFTTEQQTKQTSTTTIKAPLTQTVHFNGTVKLNVSLSESYQIVLPLPNGDLVRGSDRNFVEIWDIEKGAIKRILKLTQNWFPAVFGILSNGDFVAGYFFSKALLVCDLKKSSGEPLKRTIQTNEMFGCLTVLKNDDLAIGQDSWSNNFDIVIRDSQNGTLKKRLVGHTGQVFQIIEMKNGNLASCSDDRTVIVWNVKTGAILSSITHTDGFRSIVFLNNGYLASGLSGGTINIWNLETNQLIRNLTGHTDAICSVNCLHVLDNGDLLSASWDRSLKVWNSNDGTLKLTSSLHKSGVDQLAVLPSGNFISLSSYNLVVWD